MRPRIPSSSSQSLQKDRWLNYNRRRLCENIVMSANDFVTVQNKWNIRLWSHNTYLFPFSLFYTFLHLNIYSAFAIHKNPVAITSLQSRTLPSYTTQYTVKKVNGFPVPSRMSLTKFSLAGNNLIIPGQREFGNWHPAGDGKTANLYLGYAACTLLSYASF